MNLSRRAFLALAASAALPLRYGWTGAHADFRLRAAPCLAQILPDGEAQSQMLGYNGMTPGPELRAMQGERLSFWLENGLDEGTSIHSHGIHVPNGMDGVPELTQPLVQPGQSFQYSFVPYHAGTYWYHAHSRSWEQVAQGLYGPLIVEETNPPAVNRDITVIVDDWRIRESGEIYQDFGNLHDFSHAGRLGNFARALPSEKSVHIGDRIRLRLINTATARIFALRIEGCKGAAVAYDGMPVEDPQPLDSLILAPAQRADVIVDVTGAIRFFLMTRQERVELGMIPATDENQTPFDAPIKPLPAADILMPDLASPEVHQLVMQGGAMGGHHNGENIWALNHVSGLPAKPWLQLKRNQTVLIAMSNETAFPHGMHLHGHHFHEMSENGQLGLFRDTTLLQPRQSKTIACVFHNPGNWLLHCHTLAHQASGLKTWIEVI